jgi:simple sugar transport system ATP-binding protein/ribose transport system ATP-binding protein
MNADLSGVDPIALVEARSVSKNFGALKAVTDMSVSIATGSVHAFVGANGAGKSTLGRIIAGALRPDSGELLLDGKRVHHATPRTALNGGIVLIAQELSLAPAMSVIDNVFLGAEPRRAGMVNRPAMHARFDALLASSGFEVDPDVDVATLSIADQQKVEILRSIARRARLIVMDEPTSSLTRDEVEHLHELIIRLRDAGTSVIYVSHFLDHVLEICDQVTVMRDGRLVQTTPASGQSEASLVSAMLGSGSVVEYPIRTATPDREAALQVRDLVRGDAVNDVSLDLRHGEIVGIAGLVGSGRSELLRAIFGADRPDAGSVRLGNEELSQRGTRHAIGAGMAMVPEDRKKHGLFMQQSAATNTTLPHLRAADKGVTRWGRVLKRAEGTAVRRLLSQLSIKPGEPRALMNTMSGGNQQKVLLGRCLFGSPKVLLLDEPTRGIDIGARHALHELIVEFASTGGAVLLVSSDIEEVLGLSHRILVMRKGRLVAELGENPPMDGVMRAAFGLNAAN